MKEKATGEEHKFNCHMYKLFNRAGVEDANALATRTQSQRCKLGRGAMSQ